MVNRSLEHFVRSSVEKHNNDKTQLLAILREVQNEFRFISKEAVTLIAEELDEPRVHIEGTATFYHFFSRTHRGNYTVYLNMSATAEIAGLKEVYEAFENELGISFGSNTADNQIGLRTTSCIGMCDQEPAALINDVVFTQLTPAKVKKIIAGMKAGQPILQLVETPVENNLRKSGPVIFSEHSPGECLHKAFQSASLEIIEEVKKSNLRGRGGAGFPTGQKWGFCRATDADRRYVICNIDEGEPGTFKDRVLLTERAKLVFEGMAVAGYAVEAKLGIVYLRAEYAYLLPALELALEEMKRDHLLGKRILESRFSFDIQIKLGAGAYICGEESALIESAEGKRGTPRNRPPFPVVSGYLHQPTIINNPETYACAAKIVLHGADWFKKMGTPASTGVKLLSIAGDCKSPGVYEVEWGMSVREVLKMCGAENTMAVQVGGPSGTCISEKQFDRKIAYEDLGTGGAFTIFNKTRDLLSIVRNHMEFFVHETCGFCVPCRAGNTILEQSLHKIIIGNGTNQDLEAIKSLGKTVKIASRCGLGQSSPNPLLTSIENFPEVYKARVRQDVDYLSQFDLSYAVADSNRVTGRNLITVLGKED